MPIPNEAANEFLCDTIDDPYENSSQEEVSHRIIDRLNDLLFLFNLLDVALERDQLINSNPNSPNVDHEIAEGESDNSLQQNLDGEIERTVIQHDENDNLNNDLFSIPLLYFLPRLHATPAHTETIDPTNVNTASIENQNIT